MNELDLAISRLSFLRFNEKKILRNKLDNYKSLTLLSIEDISALIERDCKTSLWLPEHVERLIERDLYLMNRFRIQCCSYADLDFPPLLSELYDPPYMIYWRGSIECVHKNCAALVGTRKPTGRGMQAALTLAEELSQVGVTVVSGLALGIDSYAHKGALQALQNGATGTTCAVLATGIDIISPAANKKLGAHIIEKGCILSEYPPETQANKWHFPQRNRIISGLSAVTVVVEAPAGSGALITADFALDQNRDLVFHSITMEYPKSAIVPAKKKTVQQYLDDGAMLVSGAQDVLNIMSENSLWKNTV